MKLKLLLLALVLSITSAAQTMKATSLTIGNRPSNRGDYIFGETTNDLSIPVRVTEDDVVYIYSAEPQTYYKIGRSNDVDGGITWDALDQDGDRCTMYLLTIDDETFLMVTFSNICWYYELQSY